MLQGKIFIFSTNQYEQNSKKKIKTKSFLYKKYIIFKWQIKSYKPNAGFKFK